MAGLQSPTENYDLGVIESFPSINRKYLIESTVESRFDRDFLSTNSSLYTGHVTDSFIEFLIPGSDNELVDLSSLSAEVKIRVKKADLTDIAATDEVTLVDGFFHRMFQSHSVFLNGVQVEGSNHFGLLNIIKTYVSMGKNELDGRGINMMYKGMECKIPDLSDAAYFAAPTPEDTIIREAVRGTVHMMGTLNFDISACNTFLLDNVDIRIRLELARPSVVLLTSGDEQYIYQVDVCKLWVKKIVPIPGAMLALNRSLTLANNAIEYMFDRPIIKNIIFPANQTSLSIDSPFNGIIPHRIIMFMLDQTALDGDYKRNPNHLLHNNITDITLTINGNCLSNVKVKFPHLVAQAFHQTLSAIGLENNGHLLTRKNFTSGRTVFVFDTRPTDSNDVINLERKANMRFIMNCSPAPTSNKILFLIGYTLGVLQINSARVVFPNYLQ
jgi:hypothetical protein